MHFTKMHGLGNDYLYVLGNPDRAKERYGLDAAELSIRLSDRHFGVGSDGMIWIAPADDADCLMRIFNADGSEAMMCGNGIRCVAKFLYDTGLCRKKHLEIDRLSGVKYCDIIEQDGEAGAVTVKYSTSSNHPVYTDGGKLSVTVNGEAIATDLTKVNEENLADVQEGDILTVSAIHTMRSIDYAYTGSVRITSTGNISIEADIEDAPRRILRDHLIGTGSIGGWEHCEMRTYFYDTLLSLIPENVRAHLKTVLKSQSTYAVNAKNSRR